MMWLAVVLGAVPLIMWLLCWWNDVWYGLVTATLRLSEGGTSLPPGYMGLPVIGETLTFLWYFKFLRRPDDYINSKRRRYLYIIFVIPFYHLLYKHVAKQRVAANLS